MEVGVGRLGKKRLRWGCWKPAEIERISLIHICRVRTFYFVLDSCFSVSGRLIRGGGARIRCTMCTRLTSLALAMLSFYKGESLSAKNELYAT